ncbi:unnamed protein product, partial [Sphagnum troendelagicum]
FCAERGLTMNMKKQKSWCSTLLTHAKSLCLKMTLLRSGARTKSPGRGALSGLGKSYNSKSPGKSPTPSLKMKGDAGGDADMKGVAANNKSPADRKARKELAEVRKKKRKPNYDLEKDVVSLWEKTRQRNIKKDDRSKLVTEILKKMEGKLPDMAVNHIMARALQTCVKYCTPAQRESIYNELRPHCLTLAKDTYAYHLVIKMMEHANKNQLQQMLSLLHGNVVALLRHPNGSPVLEQAYLSANAVQKQELLAEFYSPEFRLFKGMITAGKGRVVDLLATEPAAKRRAVLEHMTLALQPILEKGIVDHSIIHRAIVEYLSISKKSMIQEVVQQLSGALLVRMLHTRDGAKVGVTCVMHGSNKDRKKIVKGMKGHVSKIARDEHGSMVLLSIFDVMDDTQLATKVIIKEIMKDLQELVLHKNGRRVILYLLAPRVTRYFPPDILAVLEPPAPVDSTNWKPEGKGAIDKDEEEEDEEGIVGVGKKDPLLRRFQLLVTSGLAKELADVCRVHARELLHSQWGTDVIFEVAMGGANSELWKAAPSEVTAVHKAISSLVALPQISMDVDDKPEEHVMEGYFSSRTIRRLILESQLPPSGVDAESFSAIFWSTAIKGNCKRWAKGHSAKVVSAFGACADEHTKLAAKAELQVLIDEGTLQMGPAFSHQSSEKAQ